MDAPSSSSLPSSVLPGLSSHAPSDAMGRPPAFAATSSDASSAGVTQPTTAPSALLSQLSMRGLPFTSLGLAFRPPQSRYLTQATASSATGTAPSSATAANLAFSALKSMTFAQVSNKLDFVTTGATRSPSLSPNPNQLAEPPVRQQPCPERIKQASEALYTKVRIVDVGGDCYTT
jgi:hypothetical protein